MCEGCWREYGSPKLDTPKIRYARELIDRLYDHPEGAVGGYCHIVTDDWNLSKDNIRSCLKFVADDRVGACKYPHEDRALLDLEEEILRLLLDMPLKERASALAMVRGF